MKWLLLLLLLISTASALEYSIIIEDNGNTLVIIHIEGSGLMKIPLQQDVEEVKVKGALYTLNQDGIDVSIGSTQKAAVLYKTTMLTQKDDSWSFNIDLIENCSAIVLMPKNTKVLGTIPKALIEDANYTKIFFDNTNTIAIDYEFQKELSDEVIPDDEQMNNATPNRSVSYLWLMIIPAIGIGAFIYLKSKKSNKRYVLQTLSSNEKLVVQTLLENKGGMRRNLLERKTKLAKSSLANTLNILERKKIIEIDKSSTTHFVRFMRWFDEL